MQFVTACKQSWYKVSGRNFGRFCKSITTLLRTTAAKGIIATNNWYAKTLRFAQLYNKLAYVLALISGNTTVAVSMKMSTHQLKFSRKCSDRLYPQVAFRMLLGARKPSRSVTAASLLIKYDYSVIELDNIIFRKAVEFFWYIA